MEAPPHLKQCPNPLRFVLKVYMLYMMYYSTDIHPPMHIIGTFATL